MRGKIKRSRIHNRSNIQFRFKLRFLRIITFKSKSRLPGFPPSFTAQFMIRYLIHLWAAISGRLNIYFSARAVDWRVTEDNGSGTSPQNWRTPHQLFNQQTFKMNSCMSYTSTATKNRMKDTLIYATRFKFHRKEGCQIALHQGVDAGHARGKTSGSSVQHHAGHSREHRNQTLRGHGQTLFLSGESSRCQHRRTFPAMSREAKTISRKNHGLPAQPCRIRPAVGPVLNA